MTESGYIKRLPVEEFEAQSRGGKGKAGTRLSTETDAVSQFFTCNSYDSVLFVSDRYSRTVDGAGPAGPADRHFP
jgi:DNA gyrase subunit A